MQNKHVPSIGPRYWAALSIASVFGANMGDFFAKVLGLGHVSGLPILAALLAATFLIERRDKHVHEGYYWFAIIIIRTAATNLADFAAGDMKWERGWVMLALTIVLAGIVLLGRFISSKRTSAVDRIDDTGLPATDPCFWTCMLVAGTLGTVAGDFASFGSGFGLQTATIVLTVLLAAWLYFARGVLRIVGYYWFSIVFVRTAGTALGDYLASRPVGLGLSLSTLLTGLIFVMTLWLWRSERGTRLRSA
jgi:uncharacterized membrane-anchored protein